MAILRRPRLPTYFSFSGRAAGGDALESAAQSLWDTNPGEVFDVSIALEVCHIGQHLGDGLRFTKALKALPPDLLLRHSKDEIVIANDGSRS